MIALTPGSRFAHRGLHDAHRPENSLSAFRAAAVAGLGIELDVRLTRDGLPVVLHDPDTLRDTGVHHVVESLDASVFRSLHFRGSEERLATLDEVLDTIDVAVPLLIEVKPTRRVQEVVTAVGARVADRRDTVAIQSFHPGIVRASRRRFPMLAAGQLVEPGNSWAERAFAHTIVTNAVVRPDFLAVYVSMLEEPAVRSWRRWLQCPLLAWTARTPQDAARCASAGAGMIFEGFRP